MSPMIVTPAVMIAATMTRATRVSIERDQELVDRIRELERRPDTAITALRPACLALADSSATHARVTAVSRIYDSSQLPRPATGGGRFEAPARGLPRRSSRADCQDEAFASRFAPGGQSARS